MPHADTPPATPTPEGLAAALALIDVYGPALATDPATFTEGPLTLTVTDDVRAVFAVARLCALATGAQAGEDGTR